LLVSSTAINIFHFKIANNSTNITKCLKQKIRKYNLFIGKFLWSLDAQRDNSSISKNASTRFLKPQQRKPAKIVFPPQVVQDLDEDGVYDLLALGSPVLGSRYVALLSLISRSLTLSLQFGLLCAHIW